MPTDPLYQQGWDFGPRKALGDLTEQALFKAKEGFSFYKSSVPYFILGCAVNDRE